MISMTDIVFNKHVRQFTFLPNVLIDIIASYCEHMRWKFNQYCENGTQPHIDHAGVVFESVIRDLVMHPCNYKIFIDGATYIFICEDKHDIVVSSPVNGHRVSRVYSYDFSKYICYVKNKIFYTIFKKDVEDFLFPTDDYRVRNIVLYKYLNCIYVEVTSFIKIASVPCDIINICVAGDCDQVAITTLDNDVVVLDKNKKKLYDANITHIINQINYGAHVNLLHFDGIHVMCLLHSFRSVLLYCDVTNGLYDYAILNGYYNSGCMSDTILVLSDRTNAAVFWRKKNDFISTL